MLRALGGLGSETKKALEDMLKAGNEAMAKHFTPAGHGKGNSFSKAADELDALVDAYASDKGVAKAIAYDAVLKTADGKRLYSQADAESRRPAA
ncbi:MAG: hypothetical protein WC722_19375 [Rhodospirillales bacterium]